MIDCAILGATGAVGQRFIERLHNHPTFRIAALVASDRNAGKAYNDACAWVLDEAIPVEQTLIALDDLPGPDQIPVVFSALPSDVAGDVESALASRGHKVFTNASAHRMDADVPLLIPEVNPDHLALVDGKKGWIVANGNCSGIILTLALAPLERTFGLSHVDVTTLQGLSGAGYPGVSALDVVDNVLPYIPGEEDKLETEPQKTLGTADGPAAFTVHATATRVPVREGHLASVHARLQNDATPDAVEKALTSFTGPRALMDLPSAPRQPVHVAHAADRPQPRRDRDAESGMSVTVGRLRVEGRSVRMVVLGHNTVRGAAGQSVLNAEYAHAAGRL